MRVLGISAFYHDSAAVSRAWRKVKTDWESWQARDLSGEDIVRLILDGTGVKAPADLARTVPGKNAPVRFENLMLHHLKLIAQGQEAVTRARRNAVIIAILDNLQQPFQPIAADACDNSELGQMGTQGIDQRGALTHEQVAGPMQHQD